ncbi:MAG: hypothetical protein WC728_12140 [Elusimicrobiota bacterium]
MTPLALLLLLSPMCWAGQGKPGIYPVYQSGPRWMLVEKPAQGRKPEVRKGTRVLVIGSTGVDEFYVSAATRTLLAGCRGARPAAKPAHLLSSRSPKAFERVGAPVIALLLREGAAYDPGRASFRALSSDADEALYSRVQQALLDATLADAASGDFAFVAGDEEGRLFAARPEPEKVQMKIDFSAGLRMAGVKDARLLVEGTQISKTYRRCLRLFSGDKPVGGCAVMPHVLMAETRLLKFVSYDPAGQGRPFVMAYTETEPLWGHERWGFQFTRQGPKVFLEDALDPRCRESF